MSITTLERGQEWSRRVPTSVLSVGSALVFVLATWALPTDDVAWSLTDLASFADLGSGVLIGLLVGAIGCAWYVPRLAAWTLALFLAAAVVEGNHSELSAGFVAISAGWVCVVGLDTLWTLRQRERGPLPRASPPASDDLRWSSDHHRGVRLIALVAGLAAIVVALALWANWRADAVAFAARAEPTSATVTAIDTTFDTVTASVDGTATEFWVDDAAAHPVGSALRVYTDPEGTMPPITAMDPDPSGWSSLGVPIGAIALALILLTVTMTSRRRRVEASPLPVDPSYACASAGPPTSPVCWCTTSTTPPASIPCSFYRRSRSSPAPRPTSPTSPPGFAAPSTTCGASSPLSSQR